MERLYLVRVDMQRFLGPFTLKQLKDAHARMEFGLQDEISGSLRQWVSFDDLDNIRRHYPELAQLVQTEMLSGWGMSAQPQLPTPSRMKKKRSSSFKIVLGLVLGLLLVLAWLLVKEEGGAGLLNPFRDRTLPTAQSLFSEGNRVRFEAHMDRNRETINRAMKKKKGLAQWLPYVRSVAFGRDGQWEGLSPKRLRGKAEEGLPQDCSMAAWEQSWKNSQPQWSAYLEGRELPREDWAMIMTLDPHWIKSRSPASAWLEPGSYAEACLQMSLKALQRFSTAATAWEGKVFSSRLRWQLGVISGQRSNEDFEMSGTLWALSCIEDSRDEGGLKGCEDSFSAKQAWKNFLEVASLKRRLFLQIEGQSTLSAEQLSAFQELLKDYALKAEKLKILGDEAKFFQEIVLQQGNVRAARQQLSSNQKSEP